MEIVMGKIDQEIRAITLLKLNLLKACPYILS